MFHSDSPEGKQRTRSTTALEVALKRQLVDSASRSSPVLVASGGGWQQLQVMAARPMARSVCHRPSCAQRRHQSRAEEPTKSGNGR
jgi:hypothetical protein